MASSSPVKFVYGLFIIIAFIFTLIALFTPAWRSYKGDGAPTFGVVTRDCGHGYRKVFDWDCQKWATKYPFEKITLALLILALFFEIMAIGCFFGLLSPRLRLQMPAISLSFLAFISLFAAIIIYAVRNEKKTAYLLSQTYELLADTSLGYSYWLALIATLFAFLATASAGGVVSKMTAVE
ncbi:unnamed protein product [Auanema sp. JU1783]|nr:unnamed protein product [Auanema sp. JU1783]